MQEQTDQKIFKGTIAVFTKKGFQATTKEVAEASGVAEVTLYRKYSTKENLFKTVIKNALERKFHSRVLTFAEENDTEQFFSKVIADRLETLSQNYALVKMLLSESLRGNLSKEVDFPTIIFTSLKESITHHFALNKQTVNIDLCVRQVGGIFLSYVLLPQGKFFHLSTDKEKEAQTKAHVRSIMAMINQE